MTVRRESSGLICSEGTVGGLGCVQRHGPRRRRAAHRRRRAPGAPRTAAGRRDAHRRGGDPRGARLHRGAERVDGRPTSRPPCRWRSRASSSWPAAAAAPTPAPRCGPTLEGAYALGRGEARSGRSMDALLAAYRVGARVSWRELSASASAAGVDAGTMAQFAELVFAYIDELSAASVAGHTDELSTSGRVRERYRERLGQHLLAGARDETLAAAAERATWTPPTTLTAVLLPSAQVRAVLASLSAGHPPGRRGPPGAARRGATPPGRRTPCCWCRTSTGPAAGTCCASSTGGRRWSARRGRGPAPARRTTGRCAPRRCRPWRARRGRSTPRTTSPSWWSPPTARRWPTCAPGRWPRWPTLRPATRERLAETLRAWLLLQGRRDAVAAHLHVHAQTVRYRMGQLREAYGDRLDDPARGARPAGRPPSPTAAAAVSTDPGAAGTNT